MQHGIKKGSWKSYLAASAAIVARGDVCACCLLPTSGPSLWCPFVVGGHRVRAEQSAPLQKGLNTRIIRKGVVRSREEEAARCSALFC